MKLTAQEEYGLRCILCLARAEGKETRPGSQNGSETSLTISDIAELEGISPQYAGKLIRILGKADLVQSVRGCKGGYRLALPVEKISVAAVLEALGSKVYDPGLCDRFRGDRKLCVHSNDCSVRSLWASVQLVIDRILSQTTLADLVQSERTMAEWMELHLEGMLRTPSGLTVQLGSVAREGDRPFEPEPTDGQSEQLSPARGAGRARSG